MVKNMNKRTKNILAVAGVIGTVFGVMMAIPALAKGDYVIAALTTLVLVTGLVLLALAFSD